jgi:SPX domain protein involved in polyphosphate accumulation
MGKFAHQLQSNQVGEWREKYVQYVMLSKLLREHQRLAESASIGGLADSHSRFVEQLQDEATKVEDFFLAKYREYSTRLRDVKMQLEALEFHQRREANSGSGSASVMATSVFNLLSNRSKATATAKSNNVIGINDDASDSLLSTSQGTGSIDNSVTSSRRRGEYGYEDFERPHNKDGRVVGLYDLYSHDRSSTASLTSMTSMTSTSHARDRKILAKAFVQLYRALAMLKTYALLNYDALQHLLRKYNKRIQYRKQDSGLENFVERKAFTKPKLVISMLRDIEDVYSRVFTNGSLDLAKKELRAQGKARRVCRVVDCNWIRMVGGTDRVVVVVVVVGSIHTCCYLAR